MIGNVGWQDIAVAIIAIVVGVLLLRRIWQFFFCGRRSACEGCQKECNRRHS